MNMRARHSSLLLAALGALAFTGARADTPAVPAGQAVFDRVCAACHQSGGKGNPGVAPTLAGPLAPLFAGADGKRYVAGVLTQGLSGKISSSGEMFMGAMPTQAALSDAELTDVANYLARDLNGAADAPFSADDIRQARTAKAPHKDLRALREKLLK
jgi:mono/diheme cytochrome c family protein